MIIGNGLLASKFSSKYSLEDDIIAFCAGVSDSTETRKAAFDREWELLSFCAKNHSAKKILYFGSVYSDFLKTPYYLHKNRVCEFIQDSFPRHLIVKLPQVIGHGGNRRNLFNFFRSRALQDQPLPVYQNHSRSLVAINDVYNVVNRLLFSHLEELSTLAFIEILDVYKIAEFIRNALDSSSEIIFSPSPTEPCSMGTNSPAVEECIDFLGITKFGYTERSILSCLKFSLDPLKKC